MNIMKPKADPTDTYTPRTDACPYCGHAWRKSWGMWYCGAFEQTKGVFRTELCYEREARHKAETERDEARKALILNLQTTGGMPWREWSAECTKETRRADENLERAEKAEAEVERLKKLVNESIVEKSNLSIALVNCQADLCRAIDVARMLPVIPIPAISSRDITDTLYAELNQLKATLNQTDK